jgi:hypothetical protein
MRSVLAAVLAAVLLAVAATTASAQQRDTVKTPQERIRDRLRTIGPLITDTTTRDSTAMDSIPPDSLRPNPDQQIALLDTLLVRPAEGLTGVTRDSTWDALLRLAGFVSTEYKADTALFAADSSRLVLRRAAEVVRQGTRLQADTGIVFWQETSIACAYGNPIVSGQGVGAPVSSDSLCYNTSNQRGLAHRARTQVDEGGTWYVTGDELMTVAENAYVHDAIFTDCQLEIPHYHFGAKNLKVVRGNIMVARDVTLNFGDVPVLWLPFFVQSMEQGRRSGILTPRFSVNDVAPTSTRYERQIDNVGVFWAISDHLGSELALGWRSDDFTKLRSLLEYRFNDRFLSGGINVNNYWRENGREFTISTGNTWRPDERTNVQVSGDYASSTSFIESRSLDPRELTRSIRATAGLNRRFDWGTVQMNGSRTQYLSDNKILFKAPSVGVSISPITLFQALPGEERWYSNVTVNGNVNASLDRNKFDHQLAQPTVQDNRLATGDFRGSISLGNLSLSQSFRIDDELLHARDLFPVDTLRTFDPLPQRTERQMDWSTSLSYQQRLIGTTTLTPSLSLRGAALRGDTTGGETVAAPTRIDFSAGLQTDLFGFWPGVGPVRQLRHKISPGISYSYSPRPTLTERQREVFSADTLINEVSRVLISLNQTFEAKFRRSAEDTTPADTMLVDSAGGPRRRQQEQAVLLLGINTDALAYDFVAAREQNRGVQTLEIGNTLQSDLFRGLQISFAHTLFQTDPTDADNPLPPGELPPRRFDPFLSRVSAAFSLNSRSWIFRTLGLAREEAEQEPASVQDAQQDSVTDMSAGAAIDRGGAGMGLFGTGPRQVVNTPSTPVGQWNASFSYTLFKAPPGDEFSRDNQMVTANVTMQPTELWSVQWNTGYSFTDSRFTDHILTFTRRMHDWDAYFDFIKAQNGNFSFQFRVNLRANPDIKLDYEQQDLQGLQRVVR